MYSIIGITGQVGGALARTLLAQGKAVRALVRDTAKAAAWRARGVELVAADLHAADALAAAFAGSEGVFVMLPPYFDPAPGFPESSAIISALTHALRQARPDRVVALSTIGAQARQENLLSQLGLLESALRELPLPVTLLRPGWFYENASWDIAAARQAGVVPSFLQPLSRPIPMVATADVGALAAELLQERWEGVRIVELEGPVRVSPNDVAATLGRLLGQPVQAQAVPRDSWERIFRAQGMQHPQPRMRMLDGFNEGWIAFEGTARKGSTTLETVLREQVDSRA